jgi:histone H3/H4
MAKPWATSHIATVAAGLGIEHRISGDVKERLVEILEEHLRDVTRNMEDATLAADPGRKTLDDPDRTRLGFSRTRGMMIENLGQIDSVGAAAVVAANEQLEAYLRTLLGSAANIAGVERMNTIKSRHLQQALEAMGHEGPSDEAVAAFTPAEPGRDAVGDALSGGGGGALTPQTLRQMAKSFADGKRVDDEAIEELLLLFYDHVGEVQHEIKGSLLGGNPAVFIQKLDKLQDLFMLGWMRNMLKAACESADAANSRIVLVDHVVNLDPWM